MWIVEAVVLKSPRHISVESVEDAVLQKPTDVLLRLTSTAICGTDLHIYEGRLGDGSPIVIGHEPLGVVEKVGSDVANVRVGDRVTVPTHICCGFCVNCVHGFSAQCLTNNPGKTGAAYGYPGMGGYLGVQTELARIPFADANCLRLPGEPGDDWEHDFVLLADALPTAFHATELAGVRYGDIVVIYGAGAIGLLSAMCSFLRGASQAFVVDAIPERLEKAAELGAVPIDSYDGHAADLILEQIARERQGSRGEAKRRTLAQPSASMRSASRRATHSITLSKNPQPSSMTCRESSQSMDVSRSSACFSIPIRTHRPNPRKRASTRFHGVRYLKRGSTSAWGATTTNAIATIYAT